MPIQLYVDAAKRRELPNFGGSTAASATDFMDLHLRSFHPRHSSTIIFFLTEDIDLSLISTRNRSCHSVSPLLVCNIDWARLHAYMKLPGGCRRTCTLQCFRCLST